MTWGHGQSVFRVQQQQSPYVASAVIMGGIFLDDEGTAYPIHGTFCISHVFTTSGTVIFQNMSWQATKCTYFLQSKKNTCQHWSCHVFVLLYNKNKEFRLPLIIRISSLWKALVGWCLSWDQKQRRAFQADKPSCSLPGRSSAAEECDAHRSLGILWCFLSRNGVGYMPTSCYVPEEFFLCNSLF